MARESDYSAEAAARPPALYRGYPHDSAVPTEEITARLDALIDRLRDALGTRQD